MATCAQNAQQHICWICFYTFVVWVFVTVEAQQQEKHADLLQACLTVGKRTDEGATFKAFLKGAHPQLHLHKLLWSQKQPCSSGGPQPAPSECPLTIVTTLTASRLNGLYQLCGSWPGPLVAALYVPLDKLQPAGTALVGGDQDTGTLSGGAGAAAAGTVPGVDNARLVNDTREATDMFNLLESQPSSCALRLLVLYQVLSEPVTHMLLPINSLRNLALLAASSPLISMIDVDLVISASLGQQLITGPMPERQHRSEELTALCKDRTAVILPAMEPHTGRKSPLPQMLEWADKSVKGDKAQLVTMVNSQEMCFFQELSYPRGHRLTDFNRWFKARWPYQVYWQMFYEPWFLLSRTNNPWYDVRFQGYGYNKQNHVAGMAISGFKFLVHPDAWVVHRPHDKTAVHRLYVVALNSRAKLQKAGRDVELISNFTSASELTSAQVGSLLQFHVKAMFLDNQRDAKAGKYMPEIDEQTKRCLSQLPQWNNTVRAA